MFGDMVGPPLYKKMLYLKNKTVNERSPNLLKFEEILPCFSPRLGCGQRSRGLCWVQTHETQLHCNVQRLTFMDPLSTSLWPL